MLLCRYTTVEAILKTQQLIVRQYDIAVSFAVVRRSYRV